jgi:hypothetical protein
LTPLAACPSEHVFLREYWSGISGSLVSDLTNNSAYPDTPTGWEPNYTGGGFSATSGTGSGSGLEAPMGNNTFNFGERLRGYLCVETDTTFRFFLASDETAIFSIPGVISLSEDSWQFPRDWQLSADSSNNNLVAVELKAHVLYPFELIHKQATGSYSAAIGWCTAANCNRGDISVIPITFISGMQRDALPLPTRTATPSMTPTAD